MKIMKEQAIIKKQKASSIQDDASPTQQIEMINPC